jgi:hypothetical protein
MLGVSLRARTSVNSGIFTDPRISVDGKPFTYTTTTYDYGSREYTFYFHTKTFPIGGTFLNGTTSSNNFYNVKRTR